MKKLVILMFLATFCSVRTFAQADSIQTYVTEALKIMKNKSVNKSKLNWEDIFNKTLAEASKAKSIKDTYPSIKNALSSLNDSHSSFYSEETVRAYTLGYKATGQEFPVIKSELLDNQYAYISLPDMGSFNKEDWNLYINTFYEKVNDLQKRNPKGWIIDLRGNFGGMLYPMYAAIAPFLDRKNVVGTKDAEGAIEYYNYKAGKFFEGSTATQLFQLIQKEPKTVKKPIAILVNKMTGSSAEFITAAFLGQKNANIIGTNTQGLTSGNQEYKLSDGSFLVLTIGNIVDRTGKEYANIGEGISPDIVIKTSSDQDYFSKAFEFIDGKEQN